MGAKNSSSACGHGSRVGGTITRQLRRLGASPTGARALTMDEGLSRAVRKVFVELHRRA